MEVYHLGLTMFARQLSGEGAKLFGGRWNTIGCPAIYAASSRALCVLEYAANVSLTQIPDDLSFTTYEIPNDSGRRFSDKELPPGWMESPPAMLIKEWGTAHLRDHLALWLPSVIIPSEYNCILNPLHPEFKKVRIKDVEPFTFDLRIKK